MGTDDFTLICSVILILCSHLYVRELIKLFIFAYQFVLMLSVASLPVSASSPSAVGLVIPPLFYEVFNQCSC